MKSSCLLRFMRRGDGTLQKYAYFRMRNSQPVIGPGSRWSIFQCILHLFIW